MSDEPTVLPAGVAERSIGDRLGPPTLGDILQLGEGIRSDVRASEERVAKDISDLRDDFEGFVSGHLKAHSDRDTHYDGKLGDLVSRLNAYDLDRARQQGTWGMVRWVVDLLGRNWKLIATAALAGLTLLGNIRISVLS